MVVNGINVVAAVDAVNLVACQLGVLFIEAIGHVNAIPAWLSTILALLLSLL